MPRIEKIVLNMGVGEAVNDTKKVTGAAADLALIAGQKPVITHARKAISTFKVRENMPIGAKVTLRKTRMYEFLDRLVTIALPRVRDFRGLNPKSFDGRGNYALGIKEHIIFPEIDYDKAEVDAGTDRARLRAVGVAAGVQRDRPEADARALARLVVAADVEHHLVAVDVGVVVGHRDRLLVVVDLARAEVADHEVGALEDLVHRRRLVHLAGDRHEVLDVERVGVEAAVPADDVERVRGVGQPGADDARRAVAAVLDEHLDVGAVLDERLLRAVQVALAVRRVLEELAEAGEVALGRRDVAVRLDGVEPGDSPSTSPGASGASSRAGRSRSRRGGRSSTPKLVSTVPVPSSTYTHSSPTALR